MIIATLITKSKDLIEVNDIVYWKVVKNRKECCLAIPTNKMDLEEIIMLFRNS